MANTQRPVSDQGYTNKMRNHLLTMKLVNILNINNSKDWQGYRERGISVTALGITKTTEALLSNEMQKHIILKTAIPPLGSYQKEVILCTDICMHVSQKHGL